MKQTQLDRNVLARLYGNSSIDIINILTEFIFLHPHIRKDLAASLETGNREELCNLLHYHAPAFTYSGFPSLTASCQRLQQLCVKEESSELIQKYLSDLLEQLDHGKKLAADEIVLLTLKPYSTNRNIA